MTTAKVSVPVIKLKEPLTYAAIEYPPPDFVVVRLKDLISSNGKKFNWLFEEVVATGGLHEYLHFDGKIILSLVMPDDTIQGCNPTLYASAINSLQPEFFTTVDGWTYEGKIAESQEDIIRIKNQTEKLLSLCTAATPIGQVKGATIAQVEEHTEWLLSSGVNIFTFHTSDFFISHKKSMINKAEVYTRLIRGLVPTLWLYGIGSPNTLQRFSFADGFITSTHFTAAFRHRQLTPTKWAHNPHASFEELIKENFHQFQGIVSHLQTPSQTSLTSFIDPYTAEASS